MIACIYCVVTGMEGFAVVVAFCVAVDWVRELIHRLRCECSCHKHKCEKK